MEGAGASGAAPTRSDAQVYRAKVFKSGNSLALRLPKALGLEAGMELDIEVLAGGAMTLRKAEPPRRRIDISGFWGKAKGLKVPERRDFDERPSTLAARLARGEG
ncbi:MAG: AbrB/MazE/SpoVT family DNA-binding domain-containing protein [Sphingomonadales bacterium]|nr:AbrB/MazE/SpoVT family DNA-binding domain-containing protein [Sphingomonadales bacterium]